MDIDLEEKVKEVFPRLIEVLKRRHPELVELYNRRYEYATGPYPEEMKLHNAYQILRTYQQLEKR
ncbi:MAG: hypothetical protein QXQ70_03045 [Candidatus Caldarchaeum sp.]